MVAVHLGKYRTNFQVIHDYGVFHLFPERCRYILGNIKLVQSFFFLLLFIDQHLAIYEKALVYHMEAADHDLRFVILKHREFTEYTVTRLLKMHEYFFLHVERCILIQEDIDLVILNIEVFRE